MSRENVDVVRRIYDAVARRDDVTPFELYAEDIVWDLSSWRRAPLDFKPVYHGHEGVREGWRETLAAWSEVDFEVEELLTAGDQVMAAIREREVGRASGVPIETTHVAVWTLAGGKVTRLQVFDDRRQALEAVGAPGIVMSNENVDVVRRLYDAWNRDDFEAARGLIHPSVELRQPPDLFLGLEGVYRGHAGLREWWDAGKEPWASFKSHIERTLAEDDTVLTVVRFEAVGRESGAKVELPSFANAWRLRDRLVVSFTAYYSLDQALDAVGLSA